MDKIEIIRAEIERLKEECASPMVICDTLLSLIDSFEEEPVCEKLEEELDRYISDNFNSPVKVTKHNNLLLGEDDALNFARHFANLQKKQMMKNAINAICYGFQNGEALFCIRLPGEDYLVGDEVKVIIIKEE